MWLLPLHGVLFFQHIASKLDKCLLLPPYSLALGTLAGAHKYVCISPLEHVLLLLDAVPFVCDMAFVFDMVHVVLLAIEVFQYAWVFTVVFYAAQNCSNIRPGGRKSFCRLILSCSILSCLC